MNKISSILCAHNEGHRLGACLEKLSFCDEIIVLADRCTDDTIAVAKQFGAQIIEGAWPVEGERKNAGIAAANHEWIVEIDADEHVPPELALEIKEKINGTADWYDIPVMNYIGTKLVRNGWGGSFGVRRATRLFRKTAKIWNDEIIHPSFKMTGVYGGLLDNGIDHYVDENISDMMARLDRYTTAHARELRAKGKVSGFGRSLVRGAHRFQKSYFAREGYKEGAWGLLLALMAFLYPVLSAFKARLETE